MVISLLRAVCRSQVFDAVGLAEGLRRRDASRGCRGLPAHEEDAEGSVALAAIQISRAIGGGRAGGDICMTERRSQSTNRPSSHTDITTTRHHTRGFCQGAPYE
jgi:hypothetical protein